MPRAPPLIGTYTASPVWRGGVVTCLYRDRDCTVTTPSAGRIPWPGSSRAGELTDTASWVEFLLPFPVA